MLLQRFFWSIAACALPMLVSAQPAHTTAWVNLRAGPAIDYPVVAQLGPATPLGVQGCTAGYEWCDVVVPGAARGWIYARYITYPYRNDQVQVIDYGPVIGLPILSFVIGDYWGRHYRHRPWFHQRDRWAHHGWRHGHAQRPVVRDPRHRHRPPAAGVRPRVDHARGAAQRGPGHHRSSPDLARRPGARFPAAGVWSTGAPHAAPTVRDPGRRRATVEARSPGLTRPSGPSPTMRAPTHRRDVREGRSAQRDRATARPHGNARPSGRAARGSAPTARFNGGMQAQPR